MTTTIDILPCPDALTDDQVATFREQGFVAVRDLLSPAEVAEARERLSALVHRAANNNAGEGNSLRLPEDERFHVQIEPGIDAATLTADEVELKVRKLMSYIRVDSWFHELAHAHQRLHGILTSILGEGPLLFQDMALVKPPFIGSEKPWHQDNAYFSVTPLDQVLGVWIALDDATPENGCMHVLPGGHREGARKHHHDRDCEIVPERVDPDEARAIPLPAGGALFFLGMLPHQTPPNRSDKRRRALQFHFRGADTTQLSREEYDTIFNDHGEPASCAAARPA